jgi:hypothetical protein
MVKRKSKQKRRVSRQKGFSIINGAETYLLMNVATQTLFQTNPVQFFTNKTANHSGIITLQELLNPKGRFYDRPEIAGVQGPGYYVMDNLKKNWVKGMTGMILIPLAFRAGRNISKPVIARTNRLLGKANIANTVKL